MRQLTTGVLAASAGAFSVPRARAQPAAGLESRPVGSRAGWARLITPHPFWSLHSEQDGRIASFLAREAGLPLDGRAYAVDPARLEELTAFPLIFSNGLTSVTDAVAVGNLTEYLGRGGMLYLEGCLDHRMNRSFVVFMAAHMAFFKRLYPGLAVRRFAPNHPIFRTRFPVRESDLALIEPAPGDHRWDEMPQALYGFFDGDRMFAVVSLDHLQCEWFTKPEKIPVCLRQIANIYVFAMTR